MKFEMVRDVMSKQHEGKTVNLRGWVYRQRASKNVAFVYLRDSSGVIQCAAKSDSPAFDNANKVSIESSVEITGKIKADERAPGGFELQAEKLNIVGLAERYPITKDQSPEFLLDQRHLWLRSRKMTCVMKIRSTVLGSIHEYYRTHGFEEIQAPIFTMNQCEGANTLFQVDYFGKPAYLTQSWQLYAEAMVQMIEKLYTVAPSFRAERSRSVRHLSEYWHAEMEIAWGTMDDAIKVGEECISHICQTVYKKNKKELEELGLEKEWIENIGKMTPPFPRMTYAEALKFLKDKCKMDVEWGKDLRTIEEKALMDHFKKPLVVTHFPRECKAFYMPPDPKNDKVALGFDILAPWVGEIVGGGERDPDFGGVRKRLEAEGGDPSTYEWYFDTRRFGSVVHSGFGMGVERVIQWICKLETIKDAIPFPRTMDRVTP